MTDIKRLAVITSAYTGFLAGPVFADMHKYIEEKFGRPVWTHEMANETFEAKLKELCKEDFVNAWKEALDESD